MKRLFLTALVFFWVSTPAMAFTLTQFDMPDSFVADPEDGTYYVSNVNGPSSERDGNGYISKISSKGTIVIQKFIGGKDKEPVLDAPKGLVVAGNTLYVADIDSVKGFDKKSRRMTVRIDLVPLGARLLNGLAYDGGGRLYASDILGNKIFRIDLKKGFAASVFAEGPQLGGPAGIMVNPKTKHVMAVTAQSGRLIEIDGSGRVHALKRGLTSLKGIDYDRRGNVYLSSLEKGEIYKVPNYGRGQMSIYLGELTAPSDISYDRRRDELLIPSLGGNAVTTYRETPAKNSSAK